MGIREYNMEHFIRNFSAGGVTLPLLSRAISAVLPPLYPLLMVPSLVQSASETDKYVCKVLCISYYRLFIINSCFKREVYVIDTNGRLILPVQNIYIHER
jgi:hypothetical protein